METKICSKCGEEKSLECFYTEKRNKDGFTGECKTCLAIRMKQYNKDNKEKIAITKKQYCADNKETISIKMKQYQKDNKETIKQYYEDNKEIISIKSKQYREDNPEKFRLYTQRRRALKQGLPSTLTTIQWNGVKEYFNNKCAYCGEDKPLEQEHLIALSKGGEYTHNNIIPCCRNCNNSKHDKDFFKWYPTQKQYNKERESKILTHLGYTTEDTQQLSIL